MLAREFLLQKTCVTENVSVIAIGKAAVAMAKGAHDALGTKILRCLVITKRGYAEPLSCRECTLIESDHPLPTAQSLYAGETLLKFIGETPVDGQFLALISGGASSLVEVLPAGVTLNDLVRLNEWLLKSGVDISRMNALRRQISCIKGGRLAARLAGRKTCQLLISDVPGDKLGDIGSGLLVPSPSLVGPEISAELTAKLSLAPPPPKEGVFASISSYVIGNNRHACAAAAKRAKELGYPVYENQEVVRGDAASVGKELADTLLHGLAGVYIWGGETTVHLPTKPGRGGRNQHAGLAAAELIAGRNDILLLIAGTDGSDGPGADAGALVDGETLERGERAGFDSRECLAHANSGAFLHASGDLLRTGPTATNVMDIMLGIKIVA